MRLLQQAVRLTNEEREQSRLRWSSSEDSAAIMEIFYTNESHLWHLQIGRAIITLLIPWENGFVTAAGNNRVN